MESRFKVDIRAYERLEDQLEEMKRHLDTHNELIKKMECCGNCREFNWDGEMSLCCYSNDPASKCNKWQLL